MLRHLLERVNENCGTEGSMFQIIADTVPQQDDFNEAIQRFMYAPGYRGQKPLCLVGDMKFLDSRLDRGIQAADMCAYIIRRLREESGQSKQSKKATDRLVRSFGDSLVHQRKWLP
ncbi:MAG: DUF3800 domain-containing protein [Corynebacterium sp.]|nr:DUF3800 domain-containing protein [Corynebacterium sp.]MDO4761758.1 DUF3800 domain-containing protein [Corynebacterium sp.]